MREIETGFFGRILLPGRTPPVRGYLHEGGVIAYSPSKPKAIEIAADYLTSVLDSYPALLDGATYAVALLWGEDEHKMIDLACAQVTSRRWPGNASVSFYNFRDDLPILERRDITCEDGIHILDAEQIARKLSPSLEHFANNPPEISTVKFNVVRRKNSDLR